jgi:hypothetical protein
MILNLKEKARRSKKGNGGKGERFLRVGAGHCINKNVKQKRVG